jgi:hypothetical protein
MANGSIAGVEVMRNRYGIEETPASSVLPAPDEKDSGGCEGALLESGAVSVQFVLTGSPTRCL